MLFWLRSSFSRRAEQLDVDLGHAQAAAARAFFAAPLADMKPLDAPQTANDDPMARAGEEVERELRIAGYLR